MALTEEKVLATVGDVPEEFLSQKLLRRGEIVSGTVVAVDKEGVWVDIGLKSEGIIPLNEMRTVIDLSQIQIGDKVSAYVMEREKENGRLVLSLDRARRYLGWHNLETLLASGEPLEAVVMAHNRGGLVVSYEGIQGFIPASQLAGPRETGERDGESLARQMGQVLKVKVIELDRSNRRLIFSERAAAREIREKEREKLLSELAEGETRQGRVTGVHPFGAFVDLGGMEGLVPLSELSWERGKTPQDLVKVGEEVTVQVLRVDRETKRVVLSQKRTCPHPWETVPQRYGVGQQVTGTVTKLVPFGAFVRLDGFIEGLIHISELANRHIAHPKEVVHEGQTLEVKILSIDPEKRHLRLSLRQVLEELEG